MHEVFLRPSNINCNILDYATCCTKKCCSISCKCLLFVLPLLLATSFILQKVDVISTFSNRKICCTQRWYIIIMCSKQLELTNVQHNIFAWQVTWKCCLYCFVFMTGFTKSIRKKWNRSKEERKEKRIQMFG